MKDDGWTLVSGKRVSRNKVSSHFGSLHSCAGADDTTIQKSVSRIENMITGTLNSSQKFIKHLVKTLNGRLRITNGTRLVALGCGTPTNSTLPLIRSCSFQWNICIILRDIFELDSVDIFDPVMTSTDRNIWDLLINKRHISKATQCGFLYSNTIYDTHDEDFEGKDAQLLLYMPHCEAFLYKEILNGVSQGKDPLDSAKQLANLDTNSDLRRNYDLERTVLIGNSITRYQKEDCSFLPQKIVKNMTETPLQDFPEHTEAFNNTFIITFT
ncbi:hypothetical protein BEWA_041180 [Theileria equi strain WA]|uniref:SRR1-like domain-containing protein n=1 Tax=Theileria equi strain WA TaxID=1537102 RepID=L1LFP5_THEEQ|nr:hypothetical protein BEWA_041180 [Theileria equi strain WA]EKX74080.1 hypothetical protein BEWA_041180 [Theileria equi strain WA]|eukprot:XP_004833532.1 hypothetical protein BEWA_041180 [Theileria equi strain WA]